MDDDDYRDEDGEGEGEGERGGEVECPFCGEPGEVDADVDASEPGEHVFVQDCAVCCRPWTVRISVGADGAMTVDVGRS